jgi:inner membrane protein involved in colicin E2 resistance
MAFIFIGKVLPEQRIITNKRVLAKWVTRYLVLPLNKNTSGNMSHKIPRFATEKEQQWQNESNDTSFCH